MVEIHNIYQVNKFNIKDVKGRNCDDDNTWVFTYYGNICSAYHGD